MYAVFFSTTQLALSGGTTHCTGWNTWVISAGLLNISGAGACVPDTLPPAFWAVPSPCNTLLMIGTFSNFFETSDSVDVVGKLVWVEVIANSASKGEL